MLRAGTGVGPMLGRLLVRRLPGHAHDACHSSCSVFVLATEAGRWKGVRVHRNSNPISVTSYSTTPEEPPSHTPVLDRKEGRSSDPRRLHNRVLTEDEIVENRKLLDAFATVEPDDLFGTLGSTRTRTKYVNNRRDVYPSERDALSVHREHKSSKSKKKKWANTFGTLSNTNNSVLERIEESQLSELGTGHERVADSLEGELEEDGDDKPHIRLAATGRRHTPQWYGRYIQRLGKEGQTDKAVDVLERWMLKEDRVMPDFFVFSNLLAVLGRAGRIKKAYKIFNMMKKMGVTPNAHAYTAMFNACSNSPDTAVGLNTAHRLRQLMLEQEIQPNLITSKAMLKAFGVCGDLETTFAIADSLAQRRELDAECVSFLLMACVAHKDSGFHLALQVWRKMLGCRVKPDLPLYNLLVRAVRECGIGNVKSITELLPDSPQPSPALLCRTESLETPLPGSGSTTHAVNSRDMALHPLDAADSSGDVKEQSSGKESPSDGETALLFNSSTENAGGDEPVSSRLPASSGQEPKSGRRWWEEESDDEKLIQLEVTSLDEKTVVPLSNILTQNAVFEASAPVSIFREAPGRLALLGGKEGLLRQMREDGVAPDIRTFDLLLTCLPDTCQAEEEVLVLMEQYGVRPDIDFFNTLIFRRSKRKHFKSAKDLLPVIVNARLVPNLRTFQYLAMTCTQRASGLQLLSDMESAGFSPSIEVLGTLVYASGANFAYKMELLQRLDDLGLPPNVKLLENVEKSLAHARHKVVQAEKEGDGQGKYFLSPEFQESFRKFNFFYKKWLKDKNFT